VPALLHRRARDSVPLGKPAALTAGNLIAVVWAAGFFASVSCARPQYAELWTDRYFASTGPQPGYAIKLVIGREPPATLVGDDGSVCRTSRKRFENTKEGQWIACIWNFPSLDSTQTADDPPQADNRTVALLY
jgi:hypothetical protein